MPHLMSCPTDGKGHGALYTHTTRREGSHLGVPRSLPHFSSDRAEESAGGDNKQGKKGHDHFVNLAKVMLLATLAF